MTPAPHTQSDIERIGIDESGKGDYFGPLVIAAVFVDATTQRELALMQVRDSKKISDGRILELAPDIKTICPHSIVAIGPQKYNELYAKIKNLNRLLAWGHARALENLLDKVSCARAIAPIRPENSPWFRPYRRRNRRARQGRARLRPPPWRDANGGRCARRRRPDWEYRGSRVRPASGSDWGLTRRLY